MNDEHKLYYIVNFDWHPTLLLLLTSHYRLLILKSVILFPIFLTTFIRLYRFSFIVIEQHISLYSIYYR